MMTPHVVCRAMVSGVFALAVCNSNAQQVCVVSATGKVGPDQVRLVRTDTVPDSARVGLFLASMAVNTDGAPTSYHPQDYRGTSLAINHLDNGIVIRSAVGLSIPAGERMAAFNQWRDTGWKVPAGYRIVWNNVIASTASGKPCVFREGDYAGYFGSLTALKNGLQGEAAGECGVRNQLDQRFIPTIALRGSSNPLRAWGAKPGDLVLAINPQAGVAVPAVIGDTGNGDRIGEGSVALNMALLGVATQPRTYAEARKLDTGNRKMLVAVLPGTLLYERERPYTPANLAHRVDLWAKAHYGSLDGLKAAMQPCAATKL